MNKKILYFTLATGISQLFAFAALFLYTSFLAADVYALIAIFETVLFFLQAGVGLALDRAAQRYYVDHDGKKIIALASTGVIVVSAAFFVILWGFFLLLPMLERLGLNGWQFSAIYLTATGYLLHAVVLVKYQFSEQPKLYFLASVTKTGSFFVLSLLILVYYEKSANAFIYAGVLTGCGLIIMSIAINKLAVLDRDNYVLLKSMLSYAMPFVPTLLAAWVLLWSNRLFMVGHIDSHDIGVISVAQRVGMVFFVFTQAISLVATPALYRHLKAGEMVASSQLINAFFGIFFLVATAIVFFLPQILPLVLSTDYEAAGVFITVIMFANFTSALMAVSTNILFNFYKKTKLQMQVFLICALLALLLNMLLIPLFKMDAVLFNLVFPGLALFVLHLYLCHKSTGFVLPYGKLALLLFGFAAICVAADYLNTQVSSNVIALSIEVTVCLIIGYFTVKPLVFKERQC